MVLGVYVFVFGVCCIMCLRICEWYDWFLDRIFSGGFGVFGGLIIKDFGFDKFKIILFNILFGFIVFGVIFGMIWFVNCGYKGVVMVVFCFVFMFGCSILFLILWGGE